MRAYGAALVIALLALGGCSGTKGAGVAEKAVADFHKQLNAGQFAAIYEAAGPQFKQAATFPSFNRFLGSVHRKLGSFKSGKAVGWNDNYTTNGEFMTINYAADYERGQAQEAFVYTMSGGKPVLTGYHVNSDAFVVN